MAALKDVKKRVYDLLCIHPNLRNSDTSLYAAIIADFDIENKTRLCTMSVYQFLNTMHIYGCPNFETVRRARQKVQAEHPELRAAVPVEDARKEKETEFKAFALGAS